MKTGDLVKGNYFEVLLVNAINDERLHSDMEYCRASYDQHMFRNNNYEGRDFMSNNPDSCTAIIAAPEKHYMAKLIDGAWWWVNDCAQCCGHERNWMGSDCEKHNVCRTCQTHRSELTDIPWGGKYGWQCKPCADKEHQIEKEKALAEMPSDEDYDEWDYHSLDKVTCPHCNSKLDDDHSYYDANDETVECYRCDNTFKVTAEHSVTFTTTK